MRYREVDGNAERHQSKVRAACEELAGLKYDVQLTHRQEISGVGCSSTAATVSRACFQVAQADLVARITSQRHPPSVP